MTTSLSWKIEPSSGCSQLAGVTEFFVKTVPVSTGWRYRLTSCHGLDIAPHSVGAERTDYTEFVLEQRLLNTLDRLNPDLPTEALNGAFRKLTLPYCTKRAYSNQVDHLFRLKWTPVPIHVGHHSDGSGAP